MSKLKLRLKPDIVGRVYEGSEGTVFKLTENGIEYKYHEKYVNLVAAESGILKECKNGSEDIEHSGIIEIDHPSHHHYVHVTDPWVTSEGRNSLLLPLFEVLKSHTNLYHFNGITFHSTEKFKSEINGTINEYELIEIAMAIVYSLYVVEIVKQ